MPAASEIVVSQIPSEFASVIALQFPHQLLNVPFTSGIDPAGIELCVMSTLNVTSLAHAVQLL